MLVQLTIIYSFMILVLEWRILVHIVSYVHNLLNHELGGYPHGGHPSKV